MNTRQMKTEILRARCTLEMKRDVNQIAELQQLDEADLVRIACANLIRQFKQPSVPFILPMKNG